MNYFLAILLLGVISCAPPIEPETKTIKATTIATDTTTPTVDITVAVEQVEDENRSMESQVTEKPTSPPPPPTTPAMSGPERRALISHLSEYDLRTVDPLVLTPRQQVAILQELEHQELGLPPFTEPTPWQRLTREQQREFNRKYLALREDLQEYSRNQFLSLPEDNRQAHAYQAFLSVDIQTLSQAIERELIRETQVLQQKSFLEQQSLSEQQRLDEEQHLVEHQRVVEQQQLEEFVEQQRIDEERKIIEQQRIKEKKFEQKQQQEINQLFEITNPLNEEQARSQTGNRLNILQQNVREDAKFQHFKPVKHNLPQVKSSLTPQIEIQPKTHQPLREGLLPTKQPVLPKQHNTSSLRELKRKQKRLNIRRLNFDPRRRQ